MLKKGLLFFVMMSVLLLREITLAAEGGSGGIYALSGQEGAVWGRNPFFTPEEIESFQKGEEVEKESDTESIEVKPIAWEVKSVLISESGRVAVVNDRIISVGDFLGTEQVIDINEEGVIIGSGGRTRFLALKQPSISIKGSDEAWKKRTDQLTEMDN